MNPKRVCLSETMQLQIDQPWEFGQTGQPYPLKTGFYYLSAGVLVLAKISHEKDSSGLDLLSTTKPNASVNYKLGA